MRLERGGAYTADLEQLRRAVRANGTLQRIEAVPVTHPLAAGARLDLLINMAFQPNAQMPPVNASLYVLGIRNLRGSWYFNVPGIVEPALHRFPGNPDGSYASLGVHGAFPVITNANLADALQAVSQYDGLVFDAIIQSALVRLIVSVSEAVRLDPVANGVQGVLGTGAAYTPDDRVIRSWGGHRLG